MNSPKRSSPRSTDSRSPIPVTIRSFTGSSACCARRFCSIADAPKRCVAQLDEAMPPAPKFAPLAARKLMLEAQAASILGHADRSPPPCSRTRTARRRRRKPTKCWLDIENHSGRPGLMRSKHYDEAERFLRSALERARALQSPYSGGERPGQPGHDSLHRHRYDEAVGYFEEASPPRRSAVSECFIRLRSQPGHLLLATG